MRSIFPNRVVASPTFRQTLLWSLLSCAALLMPGEVFALDSFPGALGFGATATGGRGGSVYHVTNLNDSGAGSFRDAVSSSNRIIVFDVGGYINLASAVSAKSNLTIAGQTAPGGGIGFTGAEISFANQSNIICRFIRIRPGGSSASSDDCLSLYRANTIIMDHCSLDFAKWNNIDAVGDSTRASTNFTVQNSIIADPIGQQFAAHTEMVGGYFSWFNNLFANGHNRQPLAKDNTIFINNTLYNFSAGYTTHTSTRFSHDIINNYFICGPASGSGGNAWFQIDTNQSMYYTGNLLDNDKNSTLNGSTTAPYPGYQGTGTVLASPWSTITSAYVSSGSLLSAANSVVYNLSNAGCLPHDDIESLVVSQVKTLGNGATGTGVGTAGPSGGLYTSQTQTGLSNNGFGTIAGGTPPIDSDQDGMPDDWENAKGLNPANASDAASISATGYTNLENYLNWLALPHAFVAKNTSGASSAVDIDLTQYAAGFPSGVTFTVSGVTGGATSQSGTGGFLVHFVPTLNTSGLGGFTFSVTSGGYTMSKTCGVLISTAAAAKNLLWKGNGSTNAWDTATSNWTNQGTFLADKYAIGDRVSFDDTGSHSPAVNIASVISPSSVQVNTDTLDYTFSGYGWLSGSTALVKNGQGTLTIAPTLVSVTASTTSGSPTVTVASSANLTVGMPISGTGIASSTSLSAINGTTLTMTKNATATGTPTLTFYPVNNYTGPTTFNAGTIVLQTGGYLGTGTLNMSSTLTNGAGSNSVSIGNSVVVPAGTTATINMGTRFTFGGSLTGGGTLNLNVQTNITRDDLSSSFSAFSGNVNFLGSGGVRLLINGGNFDSFAASRVNLGSSVSLQPQTNGSGNTIGVGELSGSGGITGGMLSGGGMATWSIGALNTSTTFSGPISDGAVSAAALTKVGSGTLTLTGTLSYTGTTTVSAGTLATLGTFGGLVSVSGGTLSLGTPATSAGTLTANNGFTVAGGTIVYDLSNSPSGTNDKVTLNSGALTMSGTNTFKVNFTNGVLGNGTYYLLDGNAGGAGNASTTMSVVGGMVMNLVTPMPSSGTRQTVSLSRQGSGNASAYVRLVVSGDAATLTWNGANGGVWDLSSTQSWSSTAATNPNLFYNFDTANFDDSTALGTVTLTGSVQPNVINVSANSTAYNFTGTGAIDGGGKLVKSGSGTLTISNSGTNTFTGGTTLNAGVISINSGSALGAGVITINGGTLKLPNASTFLNNSMVFSGSSSIISSYSGNSTIVNTNTNTMSSNGNATVDLSGVSGILSINGDMSGFSGTLSFGSGSGTLRLNSNSSGSSDTNFGSASTLFDLGTGSAILSNRNGGLTINLGALQGGANTTLQGRQSGSDVTSTNYVIGALNTDNVFAGHIATGGDTGGVDITKVGTGNWTLSGTSNFSGAVLVSQGALTVSGSLANGDDFEISGSTLNLAGGTITTPTLVIDGDATMTGCGTINGDLQIDGTGASSCGGTIAVNGDVTVNGTIRLTNSTAITSTGTFTNNGVLDILTGSQTLPANFVNNGVVLDSTDVQADSVTLSGANVVVKLVGYTSHNYQLQRSDSLNPTSWVNVGSAQAGAGATLTFTDTGGVSGSQRYYRVVVSP